MPEESDIRPGEIAVPLPDGTDAGVYFIGRIHTPWTSRRDCPRQGRMDGPTCRIELFPPWDAALDGVASLERLQVIYWMHEARRDLVKQSPRHDGVVRGTFALRSPVRPNPIAISTALLLRVEGANVFVRGLDCLDGTPLLDIKPDRSLSQPVGGS